MADLKLRRQVSTTFKLSGFTIKSDACAYLANQLEPLEPSDREEWIEKIIEALQQKTLDSAVIDKDCIAQIIKECCNSGLSEGEPVFSVISAFEVPHFEYNYDRKTFLLSNRKKGTVPELFGKARDKASVFIERYTYVYQCTARHSLFTAPTVDMNSDDDVKRFKLRPIESLLCTSTEQKSIVVLGMLTQMKEGKFYLEDPTGAVELDLSEAVYQEGLHTECSLLLAEGRYDDRIFHVRALGQPPGELARSSRVYFGNVNTFGGKAEKSLRNSEKLARLERENENETIVFLSDVWLDCPNIMEKFRVLFDGFSQYPPLAFVLMGNFLSAEMGVNHCVEMSNYFKTFGELVKQYPEIIQKSHFVLVPGPEDPSAARIFPRSALPQSIVEEFTKRVPNVHLATNPCRIQYCTQEIVVFRENLMTKMCRNAIHYPGTGEIFTHFVRSVVAQGHLTPLPLNICPVYWPHDAGLRIYPLPDLLVIGDQIGSYAESYKECQVAVLNSFVKSNFAFKVYVCASKTIEESVLPKED